MLGFSRYGIRDLDRSMLKPLTNTFGFASNCFVCEPTNEAGLRLSFCHDDERDVVVARHTFGTQHSGAPSLVHGGVIAAVCDDAMAWASIALAGHFALTAETRLTYVVPISSAISFCDIPRSLRASIRRARGCESGLDLSMSSARS